jgi:hypothetical protein
MAMELSTAVARSASVTSGPRVEGARVVVVPEGEEEEVLENAWGDDVFYYYRITVEVPGGVFDWLDEGGEEGPLKAGGGKV